jgi:serine/threonine-protein phosphatase 4 regulatory subunit 4
VRVVALGTLVPLAETLPPPVVRSGIVPLVRKHMQPLELELPVQRALAALFGQLVGVVSAAKGPEKACLE